MLSVIIPSKNAANLTPCIAAVQQHEPEAQIIVIDDGLEPGWRTRLAAPPTWTIQGVKPFIYARNCNLGIAIEAANDVVLLNDDALLVTPEGFSKLRDVAAGNADFGVVAATTNATGYPDQRPQGVGLRETPVVAFLCVFIPRRTIASLGLLDERFYSYGGEDVDYCRRVRQAGLKVGVLDECFVDHASLHSTFRGHPYAPGDIDTGLKLLAEKWGDSCPYR